VSKILLSLSRQSAGFSPSFPVSFGFFVGHIFSHLFTVSFSKSCVINGFMQNHFRRALYLKILQLMTSRKNSHTPIRGLPHFCVFVEIFFAQSVEFPCAQFDFVQAAGEVRAQSSPSRFNSLLISPACAERASVVQEVPFFRTCHGSHIPVCLDAKLPQQPDAASSPMRSLAVPNGYENIALIEHHTATDS